MTSILILDDDKHLAEGLAREFERLGYTCQVQSDPMVALEALPSSPVDLIVLDVMLPKMSGFEFCRRLRTDHSLSYIPVVFLSAMNSQEEMEHGLAQGGDAYVPKPIKFQDLLTRVQQVLYNLHSQPDVDELTSLLTPKSFRAKIQSLLNQRIPFALAYIEMLNLNHFGDKNDPDPRLKAIRHLARAIAACADGMPTQHFHCAHLGGGHFCVLIDLHHIQAYAKRLCELWRAHLPSLYDSVGLGKFFQQNMELGRKANILEILCCVTSYDGKQYVTMNDLLGALNHVRNFAVEQGISGLCLDRRCRGWESTTG